MPQHQPRGRQRVGDQHVREVDGRPLRPPRRALRHHRVRHGGDVVSIRIVSVSVSVSESASPVYALGDVTLRYRSLVVAALPPGGGEQALAHAVLASHDYGVSGVAVRSSARLGGERSKRREAKRVSETLPQDPQERAPRAMRRQRPRQHQQRRDGDAREELYDHRRTVEEAADGADARLLRPRAVPRLVPAQPRVEADEADDRLGADGRQDGDVARGDRRTLPRRVSQQRPGHDAPARELEHPERSREEPRASHDLGQRDEDKVGRGLVDHETPQEGVARGGHEREREERDVERRAGHHRRVRDSIRGGPHLRGSL